MIPGPSAIASSAACDAAKASALPGLSPRSLLQQGLKCPHDLEQRDLEAGHAPLPQFDEIEPPFPALALADHALGRGSCAPGEAWARRMDDLTT